MCALKWASAEGAEGTSGAGVSVPVPVPATDGLDATSFGLDFSAGLDFDPGMFSGESLNFERDFAAWFDPENAA